jgi:F-box/leucine-rich repeat protein 14
LRGCWQGNQQLSDAALAHCARMPSLQHLETSNCWHLTDAGLTRLTALTTLAHLDLSYCWQVWGRPHIMEEVPPCILC